MNNRNEQSELDQYEAVPPSMQVHKIGITRPLLHCILHYTEDKLYKAG